MKGLRGPLLLALLAACASSPRPPALPLERALEPPQLPFAFSFSRDNARVFFLLRRGEEGVADLLEIDVATGKRTCLLRGEATALSPEEQAERERRRERGKGITRYWRNPKDDSFLLVIDGDLHVLRDGELKRLTRTPAPELSPRWSPDGTSIAFVREKNLFVLRDGVETQLTTAGGGAVECGLAEFIAAEELGRDEGFWWSPDSERIAYVETDSSEVPVFFMPGLDERGTPVEQRYPRPGDPNVRWRLKVVGAGGGEPEDAARHPLRIGVGGESEYLVRAGWTPSAPGLGMSPELAALSPYAKPYAVITDRLQKEMTFLSWGSRGLLSRDGRWAEPPRDLSFVEGGFLWIAGGQIRSASMDYGDGEGLATGTLRKQPDAIGVVGTRPRDGSSRRHPVVLTRRSADGLGVDLCLLRARGGSETLLRSGGWRAVTPSEDCSRFVETASRAGEPPRIVVIDLEGKELCEIARGEAPPGLPKPEFLTIPAEDGLPMRAMLLRPPGKGPHPAILHCYGGPGAQLVADRWGGSTFLWHARMAQMGYAILTVDNRGSAGYGDEVMKAVHGRLLDLEVRDQAAPRVGSRRSRGSTPRASASGGGRTAGRCRSCACSARRTCSRRPSPWRRSPTGATTTPPTQSGTSGCPRRTRRPTSGRPP